jgi:hypothetical protein
MLTAIGILIILKQIPHAFGYDAKATISSRPERVNGHIGTETRPRLLREAAVKNLAQWGKP